MKIRGLRTGTAIAALLGFSAGPLVGQDVDEGGLRASIGIQQGFDFGDNFSLGVPGSVTNPEEGTTTLSTTAFALNVDSVTRTQKFNFQIGGALRFGKTPNGNTISTGFVDPFASISYSQDAARARLSFDASYAETAISQPRPLWDFSDENNVITPPRDIAALEGTGTRKEYDTSFTIETGVDAPVGFRLNASANGVEYENALATLVGFDRRFVGAEVFFRFNPTTTGVIELSNSRFSPDDGTPDRDTRVLQVGFDRTLADESQISARVGTTRNESVNIATPDSEGLSGSLRYDRPLPNGSFNANYSLNRNTNGDIRTLRFGRNFVFPTGALSVNIGASEVYGATPKLVGGIGWNAQTRTGSYSFNLNREVLPDVNDEDRFTTSLTARYSQTLSPLSSFQTNLSYFLSDGTALSNEVERSTLALSYQYALTSDWNLNTGINLRIRDESNVGRAESQQLFVNISRRFDLF